jgi:putative Flp pilus-assembly TadE/G-like protein
MMIVLAVVGMVGLTALAVDSGNAYAVRRHAQNTADTAALAAGLAMSDNQNWSAAALARAASNGYNNDGVNNTVTIVSPPSSGPYAGSANYIQVTIHTTTKTFFASVVGVSQLSSTVSAVTLGEPAYTTQIAYGNAMVGLAPHGCSVFWSHGSFNATVEGSGVFVNSDDSRCAMRENGSGTITAPSFNVVGGATFDSGHVIGPVLPADPIPYPPNIAWPEPNCTGTATKSGSTLSPGSWHGQFPPHGVDTLQPGVYCVSGDFRVNGNETLTGNGVTIIMESGTVVWNGGATLNLSATTTGDYAGLLLYAPMTNDDPLTINGNGDSHFQGTILAPASDIQVLGTGAAAGFHSQVVGYTVELGGTADSTIVYNDNENYDWTVPPSLELSQ